MRFLQNVYDIPILLLGSQTPILKKCYCFTIFFPSYRSQFFFFHSSKLNPMWKNSGCLSHTIFKKKRLLFLVVPYSYRSPFLLRKVLVLFSCPITKLPMVQFSFDKKKNFLQLYIISILFIYEYKYFLIEMLELHFFLNLKFNLMYKMYKQKNLTCNSH